MLEGLQDSIHPGVRLQMALIWIRIQHTGFGHPVLSVTGSVKLNNLSFVLALVTAVMMVSVLKRFMRKEQNN